MRRIIWIGDSINRQNPYTTYPQTGIAQAFDRFVKRDVVIWDRAENGRSTASYIREGWFEPVKEEMKEGDFLFIQFAHNDEKSNDPSRYTSPNTDFVVNLRYFINSAWEKKAYPVLITPAERRIFDENGELQETGHEPYVKAIRYTGQGMDVPVIDLWAKSREFLQEEGPEGSEKYYMVLKEGEVSWCPAGQSDNSHLRYEGAMKYGGMIAEELVKLDGIYQDLIYDGDDNDPYADLKGKEL